MSELDVIRLMIAIGVLLLMATSAGFGILWQRQQNLVAALQTAFGTPAETVAHKESRSIDPAALRNPALQAVVNQNAAAHALAADAALESRPAQTTFATEAARYQALLENARSRAATDPSIERSGDRARTHVNAPLGSAPAGGVQTGITRGMVATAGMPSEEDRLRALLSGRGGRMETSSRNGFGREPRLY